MAKPDVNEINLCENYHTNIYLSKYILHNKTNVIEVNSVHNQKSLPSNILTQSLERGPFYLKY